MQSNGQGTSWGSVKRSSGVRGPISGIARRPRGVAETLCMRSYSIVNGSRGKIRRGQVVKAIFGWSKILTAVVAVDTAPMGVTPPWKGETTNHIGVALSMYSLPAGPNGVASKATIPHGQYYNPIPED